MNLNKHGPHLYRLTHYGLINCYLVVEEDGLSLVDTGLAGTAPLIARAVQSLSQPVRRIALTHLDSDHIGGLGRLHELYPDAEVLVSARDSRLLVGDTSLDAHEPQVKLRGVTVRTRPTQLLHDGDAVGSLRVASSPGHTPGHMAFFDTRDGTLIAGDAFQTLGGLAVAGQLRGRFPLLALFTWHAPTALESARTLTALEPARLAVGHGPVLQNPTSEMRRATEQFARRLGRAVG